MKPISNTSSKKARDFSWVEAVFFITDLKYINDNRLSEWSDLFSRVTVAAPAERPEHIPQRIGWHVYNNENSRSEVWNCLLSKSAKDWVLFLVDDEKVCLDSFPDKKTLATDRWTPAFIFQNDAGIVSNYYQIRLVHKCTENVFEGINLPDCTEYIIRNQVQLANKPFNIERETDPVRHIDIIKELSVPNVSPQLYLIQGEQHLAQGKYVHAAAQYRKLLKTEKLLPFDRLGAVNGLARCFAEQYKWPQALALAEKSIEAEPVQRLPYLIQYRILQLNKQWKKAFEVFNAYYDQLHFPSRANFDKTITEEDALQKLGELALKAGLKKEALRFFEELFDNSNGKVERAFLKRLLVLSIDLEDQEKSILYFKKIYGEILPDIMSDQKIDELNDYMTLFMNKGWYLFVSEIYEQLNASHPRNNEYRRRLIVALSKSDRIEKARKLIAS